MTPTTVVTPNTPTPPNSWKCSLCGGYFPLGTSHICGGSQTVTGGGAGAGYYSNTVTAGFPDLLTEIIGDDDDDDGQDGVLARI